MNLRICMIGCGSFARLCHGPAQQRYIASRPDTELAACCDPDLKRAREYGELFGYARHYHSVDAMLASEKPDALILAVPPPVTCAAAGPVLEAGFPTLLEKPPGLTVKELDILITAAERGRTSAQVAFNRRTMPVMQRARAILDLDIPPESVGRINYDMVRFDRWDPDFSTTAIHALDAALFLARSPARTAELRFQPQRDRDRQTANMFVEIECASGTRVLVNIQPVAGRNTESVQVHATGRSLWLKIPASPLSDEPGTLEDWRGAHLVHSFSDQASEMVERMGILGELGSFLDAVRAGTRPTPGLADCRQQVILMEALRLGRPGLIHFAPE